MEVVKLLQSLFLFYDDLMFDEVTKKPALARTSELIEELGQVEFIFSDKTGTLTQNHMEFKKCYIGGHIYGRNWEGENDKSDRVKSNNFNINGDDTAYRILSNISYERSSDDKKNLKNFFKIGAICHSAISEKDRITGHTKYSSSSPDEVALIKGAKNMGFIFLNRTTDTIEMMDSYTGCLETYEIIVEIPFDSDRKRMSLVVRNKNDPDNMVYVLSKGADNVMLPRLSIEKQTKDSAIGKIVKINEDALYHFSCEGLRTLIFAQKSMDYVIKIVNF